MMDIILRDCGSVGWLGIVEKQGKEIYRTGKHYDTSGYCFNKVNEWLNDQEEV